MTQFVMRANAIVSDEGAAGRGGILGWGHRGRLGPCCGLVSQRDGWSFPHSRLAADASAVAAAEVKRQMQLGRLLRDECCLAVDDFLLGGDFFLEVLQRRWLSDLD